VTGATPSPRLAVIGAGLGPDRAARMRATATAMLVAMAAVFFIARELLHLHWGWGYVLAFSEAAMVGGLADWFAVTALFRRPLGLPIPHTAIIPENKDRIADTMASFLRTYFLTPQVVARRMRGMNLAGAAGNFLVEPSAGSEGRLRQGAASLIGDVLESLDPEKLGGLVKQGMRQQLERLEIAPLLGQLIEAAIADKRHMPVIQGVIQWAGETLEANEDLVRRMIHDKANTILRLTGLDEKVANAILDGVYKMLAEVLVFPDHPLRIRLEEGLEQLADKLKHDPQMQTQVMELKREILANPAMALWLDAMWERLRIAMLRGLRDPDKALAGQLGESLAQLGTALRTDPMIQLQVNRFARRTIAGITTRYGDQIVQLVSETVKRWDAHTVTDRVEAAVGRDLQFIRINGTVVGGLVGLVLHALDLVL
jgi:uncharacterized membrane-anchored protein YjiN (DUF445 family)